MFRNDRILHVHSAKCQISDRAHFPRSRVASIEGWCSSSSCPRASHIAHTEVLSIRIYSAVKQRSRNTNDTDIAKSHIEQLVWLISYPNMRVQFQSAWGIANLALGVLFV